MHTLVCFFVSCNSANSPEALYPVFHPLQFTLHNPVYSYTSHYEIAEISFIPMLGFGATGLFTLV